MQKKRAHKLKSKTAPQATNTLKESVISPLLKKPTLDKDELSNYRPISNLSLLSKIIERVVKARLSLTTLHPTTSLILTSLPTVNITPLKLFCYIYTITLLML